MITFLYSTAAGFKKTSWALSTAYWYGMRAGLKTLKGSFITHWSYAMIGQLDKSIFYQNILTQLEPNSTVTGDRRVGALLSDFRNLTLKWAFLSTHLTLLAGTEKKTISGFDTRLIPVKSPKRVKALRTQGLLPLQHGDPTCAVSTFYPYLSHSSGWGVKSSHSGKFLRGKGLTNFTKKVSQVVSFAMQKGCLNPNLAAGRLPLAQRTAVFGDSVELNFLFSTYENNALYAGNVESAYLGDAKDNPNLVACAPAPYSGGPSLEAFKSHPLWLAGRYHQANNHPSNQTFKGPLLKVHASQLCLLRGL